MRHALVVALIAVSGLHAGCKQGATEPAPGTSATAAGEPYSVTVTPPSPGKVGVPVVATVKMVPKNGYKVNLEYPTKLTVQAPAGAEPASQVLAQKNATRLTAGEAVFAPRTTFSAAGDHRVAAILKFSVCTDKVCEMKTETLSWITAIK